MKETLASLCEDGLSSSEIADRLCLSKTTIRYYLNKFSLKTRFQYQFVCKDCGVSGESFFHSGRKNICKECSNQKRHGRNKKHREYALAKLGDKCVICGYNEFKCSLDIHHLDPSFKDENFESMRSWSISRIDSEIEKCVLLCKNCHAALHAGYKTI